MIEIIIGALTAATIAVGGGVCTIVKLLWNKQKALENGVIALLHDRIKQCYESCEQKGFANINDRENLEVLYTPYHNLGGNSTGTDLYCKIKDLPTNSVGNN